MENQTENVVEQVGSKKGLITKIVAGVVGILAVIGGVIFFRKRQLAKLNNEEVMIEDSEEESIED